MTDRTITIISLVSTSILVGATASAIAEPGPPSIARRSPQPAAHDSYIPAASGGLEIAIALSAAESTGDIGDGMNADDLIGSAGQLDLEIGHRVTPHLTIGFYTNAQALADNASRDRNGHTGAAGIEADFHVRPDRSLDPWMSIGSGVRAYLIDDGDYTVGVGAELVRLQVGVDFRDSEHFAIGPVFGASASLYGAEKQPMQEFHELSGKGINWTLTGGIAGRFNLFTNRH